MVTDFAFADFYHFLVPWLGEHTGVDRATIVKVLGGQEQFWDIYGERIKKALEEEENDDADE